MYIEQNNKRGSAVVCGMYHKILTDIPSRLTVLSTFYTVMTVVSPTNVSTHAWR